MRRVTFVSDGNPNRMAIGQRARVVSDDAADAAAASSGLLLSLDAPGEVAAYLRGRGWIGADEPLLSVAPAGDGNMNWTVRVVSDRRRLIVKQGRPWVERYPEIPAPADRTLVETRFYQYVQSAPGVARRMPALLGSDEDARVLVLADCDGFADLTSIYETAAIAPRVLAGLLDYLASLHAIDPAGAPPVLAANAAMRALNHEYIFRRPLAGDAALYHRLEVITPGLSGLARQLAAHTPYVERVRALGDLYLRGGATAIVHGDFFPGSWLTNGTEVRVIDPEFCFVGAPEFDYGVMAAHLILSGDPPGAVAAVAGTAAAARCDVGLAAGFAGVEIMRRLLGVAQLPPLKRTLGQKTALLERSRRLVCGDAGLADP